MKVKGQGHDYSCADPEGSSPDWSKEIGVPERFLGREKQNL